MTHFVLAKNDEELLGFEVPYLSAIGALMYLANCTSSDIAFFVNLLARYMFHSNSKTLEWYETYIALSSRNY